MKHRLLRIGFLTVCSGMLLTGCIDSAYDLSDIDTETEIKINNLVLPINIDQLNLDDVISIDEGSKIQIVDGKYAVLVEGTFESDEVKIKPIMAESPAIDESIVAISAKTPSGSNRRISSSQFDVPEYTTTFSYHEDNIDSAIKSLSEIEVDNFSVKICFSVPELSGIANSITFTDLHIQLPKGMTTADTRYDAESGLLSLASLSGTPSETMVKLDVTAFDLQRGGATFNPSRATFDYEGEITIKSATLNVNEVSSGASVPGNIKLHTSYILSSMDVKTVTGDVDYIVDEFNVDPIDLTDLPDFLAQEETNLILDNPQIYLTINNPMGVNGATASTGIALTSYREGERPRKFELDNGRFAISDDMGDGPYNFCLSPRTPEKYYPGFETSVHEDFSTLGEVLSGAGLPDRIEVDAFEPRLNGSPVRKLPVGRNIGRIGGKYVFYAPLALEVGSRIVYSKSVDGWSSEDLDAVTIQTLEVTAEITTDIDQTVKLTGYPIDVNGNAIDGVEIEGAEIPANAKDYKVTIRTTGEVRYLDGFVYEVTALSGGPEQLSPDQHIVLKNVRAKVSGKYVKEL